MQSYQSMKQMMYKMQYQYVANSIVSCEKRAGKLTLTHEQLWPLLLTWFNFNPSMDK